eukprot:TRINITY_DN3126_c0_g5_i1.p1 TRINITY_DN3126_c0_g5~~TRINITY_DN3126_c0_g5_i1.p1  ORF type:complete len:115 (-),score=2.39 TRINITY_DN3126_c0_g5_i1:429-773(-)
MPCNILATNYPGASSVRLRPAVQQFDTQLTDSVLLSWLLFFIALRIEGKVGWDWQKEEQKKRWLTHPLSICSCCDAQVPDSRLPTMIQTRRYHMRVCAHLMVSMHLLYIYTSLF